MYILSVNPSVEVAQMGMVAENVPVATKEMADACLKANLTVLKQITDGVKVRKVNGSAELYYYDEFDKKDVILCRISIYEIPVEMNKVDIEIPEV